MWYKINDTRSINLNVVSYVEISPAYGLFPACDINFINYLGEEFITHKRFNTETEALAEFEKINQLLGSK